MKYITAFGATGKKRRQGQGFSFQKFIVGVCILCGVFVCSLFAFAMNDSDAYQLLLNNAKGSFGTKFGDFVEKGSSGESEEEEGYSYEWGESNDLRVG